MLLLLLYFLLLDLLNSQTVELFAIIRCLFVAKIQPKVIKPAVEIFLNDAILHYHLFSNPFLIFIWYRASLLFLSILTVIPLVFVLVCFVFIQILVQVSLLDSRWQKSWDICYFIVLLIGIVFLDGFMNGLNSFSNFLVMMMQHGNNFWLRLRFSDYLLRFLQLADIRIFVPVVFFLLMLLNLLWILRRRIMPIKLIFMRHLGQLFIDIIRLYLHFLIFLLSVTSWGLLLWYLPRLAITKISLYPLLIVSRLFHQLL